MKKQGSGNTHPSDQDPSPGTPVRDQGSENMETLMRGAIPRIDIDPAPPHDLWPAMQARLNAEPALAAKLRSVPWFDWALAAGLALFALVFPRALPMLLYYL